MVQYVDIQPQIHKRSSTEFTICVCSMRNYDLNGQVSHSLTRRAWAFDGVLELLNVMKQQITRYGVLQASCKERTWNVRGMPLQVVKGDSDMPADVKQDGMPGGAPSFLVRVHYCQGATWQGTIQWLDTGKTMSFRSTLEMIHLMEQVVAKQMPQDAQEQQASWDAD